MSYFDTVHEPDEVRKHYEQLANTQEGEILSFFKRHWTHEMSPGYIHKTLFPNVPITSVRRAMTNLTKAGCLEKTENKTEGQHGRLEFRWKYVIQDDEPKQMKLNLK